MKAKVFAAMAAAGALSLSGCASQMISDLNNAFDNPARIASGDGSPGPLTSEPYESGLAGRMNPPPSYPLATAAYIPASSKQ
jgi:hypothetical protein